MTFSMIIHIQDAGMAQTRVPNVQAVELEDTLYFQG